MGIEERGAIVLIKGRIFKDELRYIDNFFNNLSDEEFEKMLIECGAKLVTDDLKNDFISKRTERYCSLGFEKDFSKLLAIEDWYEYNWEE